MNPDPIPKPTPIQALENLRKVSEAFNCDGPTRDVLRQCVTVLSDLIQTKTDALSPNPTR